MLNKNAFHRFLMYLIRFIENKSHISSPKQNELN